MSEGSRIGAVARSTGVPAKTIRYYEDEGLLPPPARSENGYRLYTDSDVQRLRLIKGARLLGLSLPQIRSLLDRALSDGCAAFGDELQEVLGAQLTAVEARIAELMTLREDLLSVRAHVAHCCEEYPPDGPVAACDFCGISTAGKGGDPDACEPADR